MIGSKSEFVGIKYAIEAHTLAHVFQREREYEQQQQAVSLCKEHMFEVLIITVCMLSISTQLALHVLTDFSVTFQ